MPNDDLAFTPALELARLIRSRELSPVELVDHMLGRIKALNPKLNAYLTIIEAEARADAREAEAALARGNALPPLHGVPVSIKDLHFVKGVRCTGGSLAYKDFVPTEDCVPAERLRCAGAIILGKTNTSEFGESATTENRLGPDCCNPWDVTRTSGGSSGGAAAAVATGLGPLALGSDGGGSIRIPSGFCGVFGLKPTHGRVPLYGGLAGMPLFAAIGPIARTVRDAALMLSIMAGHDHRDPISLRGEVPGFLGSIENQLPQLHIAWSPDLGYARVDPEVRSVAGAAARVFEALGCSVEEETPALDEPFSLFSSIVLADDYAWAGHLLDKHADELMPYVKASLEQGREVPGYRYSECLRQVERFRMQMSDFFEKYDLLLTPTNAVSAFPLRQRPREIAGKEVSKLWGAFPFTVAFNITGQPAANLPCGFSEGGLPIGLQIAGRFGDEATVLKAAAAFEQAQPWADKQPPLAKEAI